MASDSGGTSTVLQWTCQKGTDVDASDSDTELWNDNGCLQCKAYNDAWDDLKLGYQDLCMAVSPDWIASLFKPQSLKSDRGGLWPEEEHPKTHHTPRADASPSVS